MQMSVEIDNKLRWLKNYVKGSIWDDSVSKALAAQESGIWIQMPRTPGKPDIVAYTYSTSVPIVRRKEAETGESPKLTAQLA